MSLEKVAERAGIPAQDDAPRVARFAEQGIERGGAVARDQRFGPREDNVRDGVELEGGALQQGGQVLGCPREDVYGPFLEDSAGAGEAGDGMDAGVRGCGGDPLCRAGVVRTQHEHAGTHAGATYRRWRAQQIPHVSCLLHRRGPHQHHRPAALQRGLRVCFRHTVLDCQRAIRREGWYGAAQGKATVPRHPHPEAWARRGTALQGPPGNTVACDDRTGLSSRP